MATRRPLQSLRPLSIPHSSHTQCINLPIRSLTTTTTPPPNTLSIATQQPPPEKPPRRAATWIRAVAPPKQTISWESYSLLMQKSPSIAHRPASDDKHPHIPILPPPMSKEENKLDVSTVRLLPASPSYFSTQPNMNDDVVHLASLLRRYASLPKIPKLYEPKAVWKPLEAYQRWLGEAIPPSRYLRIRAMLERLNRILPELRPQEVKDALNAHLKDPELIEGAKNPVLLDEWGRGFGKGRRKTARAMAYLVEGSGEVLVNERNITDVFGRVKDREMALWPLTATGRMSRYNVFAIVRGGGTTGWAEAMALAVAKAVLVHEPGLKPAMRRAGVIRRDPRKVERKKPGHLKARKMPAWVRR